MTLNSNREPAQVAEVSHQGDYVENDESLMSKEPAPGLTPLRKSTKGLHVGGLKYGWAPYDSTVDKKQWYLKEALLGLVICFAQIPERVAFAFLANVDPSVGIHAAWQVGLICSALGGRPAMVNGATGAFAAIIATFIPAPLDGQTNGQGIEYLFPSVILAGCLMFVFSILKAGRFVINLIGSTVMLGFCNGLAVVIGRAQLHPFEVCAYLHLVFYTV